MFNGSRVFLVKIIVNQKNHTFFESNDFFSNFKPEFFKSVLLNLKKYNFGFDLVWYDTFIKQSNVFERWTDLCRSLCLNRFLGVPCELLLFNLRFLFPLKVIHLPSKVTAFSAFWTFLDIQAVFFLNLCHALFSLVYLDFLPFHHSLMICVKLVHTLLYVNCYRFYLCTALFEFFFKP